MDIPFPSHDNSSDAFVEFAETFKDHNMFAYFGIMTIFCLYIVNILLLNVLIALINNAYERISKSAESDANLEAARLLLRMEHILEVLNYLICRRTFLTPKSKIRTADGWLVALASEAWVNAKPIPAESDNDASVDSK